MSLSRWSPTLLILLALARPARADLASELHALHHDAGLRQRLADASVKTVTLDVLPRQGGAILLQMSPSGLQRVERGTEVKLDWNPLQLMTMWVGLLDTRTQTKESLRPLHGRAIDAAAREHGALTPARARSLVAGHLRSFGARR